MMPHEELLNSKFGSQLHKKFLKSFKSDGRINLVSIEDLASVNYAPAYHVLGELSEFGYKRYEKNYTKAFQYYKKAADLGYTESHAAISFFYKYGIGMNSSDLLLSNIHLMISCQESSMRAYLSCVNNNRYGFDLPKSDYYAAFGMLNIATLICNSEMESALDQPRPFNNDLTLPDIHKTINEQLEYTKYRAAQGNKEDQIKMGKIYYHGIYGQKTDYQKAYDIFEKNKDLPEARNYLGQMYLNGNGIAQNKDKALEFFKSARKEDAFAAFQYSKMIMEENPRKSQKYIFRSCQMGHQAACFNIAQGQRQIHPKGSAEIFRSLSKNGFSFGSLALAEMIMNGEIEYDEEQVYKLSASIVEKGPWLELGKAAEEALEGGDPELALFRYIQLADLGSAVAAYNAGMMLLRRSKFFGNSKILGMSEKTVSENTLKLLKAACKMGFSQASIVLAEAYFVAGEREKGLKVLGKDSGKAEAAFAIAEILINGDITPRSIKEALDRLSTAISKDKRAVVPALLLAPRIVFFSLIDLIRSPSRESLMTVWAVINTGFNWHDVLQMGVLVALIMLVRQRIKITIEQSNEAFIESL